MPTLRFGSFPRNAGACDIWHSRDFPPGPWAIEHERLHCRGYDHIGGNVLKRALAAWQEYLASRGAQSASAGPLVAESEAAVQ